jgi:hypothetical protein
MLGPQAKKPSLGGFAELIYQIRIYLASYQKKIYISKTCLLNTTLKQLLILSPFFF